MPRITSRLSLTLSILFVALFSLNAQTWEQQNDPPFYNHHSNGFGFDGKAYVIQGASENFMGNAYWSYDPQSDSWTKLGNIPGPSRELSIGDYWNGKYYYGFGYGPTQDLNDIWVFDPADLSFTQLPSCPCIGRGHPAMIAHNDKIFVGGGSGPTGNLEDWWVYDMLTQEWAQKENIPGGGRHHPFFFASGDNVYVGGGHNDMWLKYNVNSEIWSEIDNLPEGRVAGTQIDYNGQGFIIGGDDQYHYQLPDEQSFMRFDPGTESWEYLPELPNRSRWAPSSFIVDDYLYFFGGLSAIYESDSSMWKFDLNLLECLPAFGLNAVSIDSTAADLFWTTNSSTVGDTLAWRKLGDADWNTITDPQVIYNLTDLDPCQQYEFQVLTSCADMNSFSLVEEFTTKGCGACRDISYCPVPDILQGGDYGFINEVHINDYINNTGNNKGYEDFTGQDVQELKVDQPFKLGLDPSSSVFFGALDFKVWIDYNADGIFDEQELIIEDEGIDYLLNRIILPPADLEEGITRMRVFYGHGEPQNPCEGSDIEYGEMEDYCLNFINPSSNDFDRELNQDLVSVYPNPFTNAIGINVKQSSEISSICDIKIQDVHGKLVKQIDDFNTESELDVSSLLSGIYFLTLEDMSGTKHTIKIVK